MEDHVQELSRATRWASPPRLSTFRQSSLRYAQAALFVGIALLFSLLIHARVPSGFVYLFLGAVVASGWFVGKAPGLFAAIVSTLTVDYFFLSPIHSLGISRESMPYLIPYLVAALAGSWISSARRTAEESQTEKVRLAVWAEQAGERFLTAFEHAPIGMCLTSPDGRFLQANRAFCEMLRYSGDELLKGKWSSITHPDDLDISREAAARVQSGEVTAAELEKRYIRGDGRVLRAKVKITLLKDDEGRPSYHLTHVEDITEQKRAEEALQESEQSYRSLVMSIPDVVATIDAEGRIAFVSPNFEKLSGYTIGEAYEKGLALFLERVHPDDTDGVVEAIGGVRTTGERREVECRLRRKDGEWIWVHCRAVRTYEWHGRHYAVALISDISDRKRAEAENARLAAAVSQAGEGILITDLNGMVQYVNPGFSQITGYSAAEAVGQTLRPLKSDQQDAAHNAEPWPTIRSGRVWKGQLASRRKDGTLYTEEMTIAPVRDASGAITNFVALQRDVTERKAVEAALYESRQMLQSILDNIPQRVFWKDRDLNFLGCNLAFAADAGFSDAAEIVGKSDFDTVANELADAYRTVDRLVMAQGSPRLRFEEPQIRAEGRLAWLRSNRIPLRDQQGEVIGVLGTYEDITEERQAEHTRAFLASIVESSSDAIMGTTLDGKVVSWNRGAELLYGYRRDEVIGKAVTMLAPPGRKDEVLGLLEKISAGEPTSNFETLRVKKDGTPVDVSLNVSPIKDAAGEIVGAAAIARDITERKRLLMELQQAQKLEAVGQLAAGIAHEINTPIQFVGDNTRFLRQAFQDMEKVLGAYEKLAESAAMNVDDGTLQAVKQAQDEADWEYLGPEIPKALDQTLDGVDRVARIVRAMKEFSHVDQSGGRSAADLNKALDSTLVVARNELKYVADVVTEFGEIPPVVCHLGELNQVFLNLLINAAHAIADVVKGTERKGTIRVKTWQEEDQVVVAVSDTGTGIPEGIRDRIFDPFFTTKEVGRGTGQGLALARNVIRRHSGSLTFETHIGKGSTFFVRLPVNYPQSLVQET